MKKQLLLRIEDSQLEKIKEAAVYFKETTTSFLINAALLRMQTGVSPQKTDPFEEALLRLRAERATVPLSPQAQAAVLADRDKVRQGKAQGVPASQALKALQKRLKEAD